MDASGTSARPTEAAIAKVFAKIRQKILFCKFFGPAGRTGTSRTTSCQNFSLERPLAVPKTSKQRENKSEFFMISEPSFSSFLIDFGGARLFLTSKSSSSRFFALDGQIFRSVRRLELIFKLFTVRRSTCRGNAQVIEIPGGRSPPDPPGGKAWVTEIPEGGFASPDLPTTTFQKRRLRRQRSSTQRLAENLFGRKKLF